jgi:hypothetical protein
MSGPGAVAVAELIGVSDSRERTLQARLDGWRDGHALGFAEGLEAGCAQASAELLAEIDEEKRLRQGILQALSDAAPPADRWLLLCGRHRRERGGPCGPLGRCERRTRETFGAPHPDDWPPALAAAHRAYLARTGESCPVPQCPACAEAVRGAA